MAKKKVEFNLALVKKYAFWAVIPLGLLAAVFTTFLAAGSVGKAFNERKNALDAQKKQIQQIQSDRKHPNEQTIEAINTKSKELRKRVRDAWATLEKEQRRLNRWPEKLGAFIDEVAPRQLKPDSGQPNKKFHDPISQDSREKYLNFIELHLPELEVRVDRRRVQYWDPAKNGGSWRELDASEDINSIASSGNGAGGYRGGGSPAPARGGRAASSRGGGIAGTKVAEMNNQGLVEPVLPKGPEGSGPEKDGVIFRYVGTVDWSEPETRQVTVEWDRLPKSNEVWYAQEELWVYSALLNVIKESNRNASGPHNAVVKRIENLLIGQQASEELEKQSTNRIGGAVMGMGGADMGGPPRPGAGVPAGAGPGGIKPGGMGPSGMSGSPVTEEDVIAIKQNLRYVDDKGVPLGAGDKPPFDQFKRMPVCLRLIVDQRRIPEILVNCANCEMPIDILWVRFNPGAAKPFELTAYGDVSSGAGGMGGTPSMGSSMPSRGGAGGRGGDAASGGGSGDSTQYKIDDTVSAYGSNAIPIEIYGCINIFNPVEYSSLDEIQVPGDDSATLPPPAVGAAAAPAP